MPKATDNHTPPSFTRRVLALGGGAFASVGLIAGTAATAADLAPHPDAELIRLSGIIVAGHAELDRYTEQYEGNEPPEFRARVRYLVDEDHELSEQMAEMPATTIEGLRAKAAALLTYVGYTTDGGPLWSGHDELLGWSIAQDLLGRA